MARSPCRGQPQGLAGPGQAAGPAGAQRNPPAPPLPARTHHGCRRLRGAALGRAPRSAHVMAGRGGASPPMHRRNLRQPQSPGHRRWPSARRAAAAAAAASQPAGLCRPARTGSPGALRSAAGGLARAALAGGRGTRPGAAAVGAASDYARHILPRTGEAALPAPPRPALPPEAVAGPAQPIGAEAAVSAHAQFAAARRRQPSWSMARCLAVRGGAGREGARPEVRGAPPRHSCACARGASRPAGSDSLGGVCARPLPSCVGGWSPEGRGYL